MPKYYTLAGGGVEREELPTRACKWESKQETGLDAEICAEVCPCRNMDSEEHYFLATRFQDVPELGGPERAANGPENHYDLVWVQLDDLLQINLKHERLQGIIPSVRKTLR